MQFTAFLIFVLSCSLSLALVGLGLTALNRALGVVPLEVLPLGISLALTLLSLGRPSTATISAVALLPLDFTCAAGLFLLHPVYVILRRRLGGESLTLMISFAIMTCWGQLMSIAAEAKSIHPKIPEWLSGHESIGLRLTIMAASGITFILVHLLVNFRGNMAALQLSKGDARLLTSFGLSSRTCQRLVLLSAIVLVAIGSLFYISLQETFSLQNSYDIIVPAFGISLAQPKIRVASLVAISVALLSGIEGLTRLSGSSTVREAYQGVLFGAVVLIVLLCRLATRTGRLDSLGRRSEYHFRQIVEEGRG